MTIEQRPGGIRLLAAAPHRLPFLTGAFNLIVLPTWWFARLMELNGAPPHRPQVDQIAATFHGPLTLYSLFMPFIMGFLLTVSPRWMGLPDLAPRRYLPASIPVAVGSLLIAVALCTDRTAILAAGLMILLAGWIAGVALLARVLAVHCQTAKEPPWHGWSALGGCLLGMAGLAMLLAYALGWFPGRAGSILLGADGLTAIVFLTVCHRMIPFFAGNVVAGYIRWRPYWLLGAIWVLMLADMAAHLWAPALRLWSAGGLALLLGYTLWRWAPRGRAPGLLIVLFLGFAWAPVAFAFAALSTISDFPAIASTHALLLGMGASLVIAMVTRVTQGHSGRPLEMPLVGWIAFVAVQAAAITRIIAAMDGEALSQLLAAALIFAAGVLPWALRGIFIYLVPRQDGRPG
nr:NnrS family protein [uncultured Sphingomonas sp.]